jgi:hypothetical protein
MYQSYSGVAVSGVNAPVTALGQAASEVVPVSQETGPAEWDDKPLRRYMRLPQ